MKMTQRYLEVTFRSGKPLAAYLYLPRQASDVSVRTERHEDGLLVDFTADGRAIGVEITSPNRVSLDAMNRTLKSVEQSPISAEELAPVPAGR